MITADLGAELAAAVRAAAEAGHLPPDAVAARPSGTWRRPPGAAPGSYASSLPFEIGRQAGLRPARVAGILAARLRGASWIHAVSVTGDGYLTVTVTPPALAFLAVRIAAAGRACARSESLGGAELTAPPLPDLAAAPTWPQARRDQAAALTGRLAAAAGATVVVTPEAERTTSAASPAPPGAAPASVPVTAAPAGPIGDPVAPGWESGPVLPGPGAGPVPPVPVSAAVAYAGPDVVRYLLARTPAGEGAGPAGAAGAGAGGTAGAGAASPIVSNRLSDPAYLVRFAHADAGAVRRWAGELGLARTEADARLARLLAQPAERVLLDQLSWLPERIAGAARRGRPEEFPRYLESVAAAWLDCREACPALPFGGHAAPRDAAGRSARLWLAEAARTVLGTGLELIGIGPVGVSHAGLL